MRGWKNDLEGKNGRLCILITKALSLVSNKKMELCLQEHSNIKNTSKL